VPLSCNLGTLTFWNPLDHSRPVTGLLYLYYYILLPEESDAPYKFTIIDVGVYGRHGALLARVLNDEKQEPQHTT